MGFRQLSTEFAEWLNAECDGAPRWPAYQKLSFYSREFDLVFTHREYARLKKYAIGSAEVVEILAGFLARFRSAEVESLLAESDLSAAVIPLTADVILERLTRFADGDSVRSTDFERGSSWRELPLIMALRDRDGESHSICRSEEIVRQLCLGTFLEAGRPLVARRDRRNAGRLIAAAEESLFTNLQEHTEAFVRLWRELPECVWLVKSGKRVIGGSIVMPVQEQAFERFLNGTWHVRNFSPSDVEYPGRQLKICGFATLPDVKPSRLPGLWSALRIRKLCQHGALLIGDDPAETRPVHIGTAARNDDDAAGLSRLGYRNTGSVMPDTSLAVFELTAPAPEQTCTDFSTPATTIASLMGVCWRLLNSHQVPPPNP